MSFSRVEFLFFNFLINSIMAGRLTKEQIISNVNYDVEECGVGWEELEKSSEADNCVQLNPQHTHTSCVIHLPSY